MINKLIRFLIQFVRHPRQVGAIAPSSKALSEAITREIVSLNKKQLILEVGPGTGAFTEKILEKMGPLDELHLVEVDERFCRDLEKKYRSYPHVKIFKVSITEFQSEELYDVIISGLPLNGFDYPFVKKIFMKFLSLIKEGGKLSYFEYTTFSKVMGIFAGPKERRRLLKIGHLKQLFYDRFHGTFELIHPNIPPAKVLHHHIFQK